MKKHLIVMEKTPAGFSAFARHGRMGIHRSN
jgi:hypothetical protein